MQPERNQYTLVIPFFVFRRPMDRDGGPVGADKWQDSDNLPESTPVPIICIISAPCRRHWLAGMSDRDVSLPGASGGRHLSKSLS